MPPWLESLLIAGGGLTLIGGGVGAWWRAWREDRRRREDLRQKEKQDLIDRVERLQLKVESLLMDAIAREKESNIQMQERIEMDAKQNNVIAAATVALKDAAAAFAKIGDGKS